MDLLDVVELMILIEDQFTDVEITDHEPEIEFVGDLIRHIEIVDDARANRAQTALSRPDRSTWRAKQSSVEKP
jgi:hypothetical protein